MADPDFLGDSPATQAWRLEHRAHHVIDTTTMSDSERVYRCADCGVSSPRAMTDEEMRAIEAVADSLESVSGILNPDCLLHAPPPCSGGVCNKGANREARVPR